jgi:hypothetical protein
VSIKGHNSPTLFVGERYTLKNEKKKRHKETTKTFMDIAERAPTNVRR